MITLVGLCGFARSGKDTAAGALLEMGWSRFAFADPLKQDIAGLLKRGLSAVPLDENPRALSWLGEMATVNKSRLRPLLVSYGAAMREFNPNYWIDRLNHTAEFKACRQPRVITDVRYINEAEWVRSLGGVILTITRPGIGPANAEEADKTAAVKPDAEILNTGSVDDLHRAVRGTLERLTEERRRDT